MNLRSLCAVLALVGLVGCEKPCKQGFQRYGVKCVRSLVAEAGVDKITGADGGMPGIEVDSGGSPLEPALDSGLMDASEQPSTPDAGASVPSCYLDKDGDGAGAGEQRPCSDAGDAGVGTLVSAGGDCDDEDEQRSPSMSDVCGDGIDNDCDGKVDDESNNACGGPCTTQLGKQPGEACSNGLLGACARPGEYVCDGPVSVVCNAPSASPSAEICSDNLDNDCDGSINEGDAVDRTTWYKDCDGDGFAPTATDSTTSCTKPAKAGSCTWTALFPQEASFTNWDCNDARVEYAPNKAFGMPPAGASSFDLNCDGIVEKERMIAKPDGSSSYWWCPAEEIGEYCAYWTTDSGTNLSVQPACSASSFITYPADSVGCGGGLCKETPFRGLQYCK